MDMFEVKPIMIMAEGRSRKEEKRRKKKEKREKIRGVGLLFGGGSSFPHGSQARWSHNLPGLLVFFSHSPIWSAHW